MSPSVLPYELLSSVFGNVSSPTDLAHLAYCSKTFASVVKPLLYSSIKIANNYQRVSLGEINHEDAKLVQKVSVIGSDEVWNLKVDELEGSFAEEADGHEARKQNLSGGCVQDLMEGELFEVNTVKALVVRDALENPQVELQNLRIQPTLAGNLRSLSILTHRGGARLWKSVLTKKNLPSLRLLVTYDITLYAPADASPPRQSDPVGCTALTFQDVYAPPADHRQEVAPTSPKEFVVTENLLETCDLLDQLELLVSPEFPFLDKFRALPHLAIVAEDAEISNKTRYAVVHIGSNTFADAVDHVFIRLWFLFDSRNESMSLEYLSIGAWAKDVCDMFEETFEAAEARGVKLCFDAEEDEEFIPKSFVKVLEEEKAKKSEKEKK